MIYKLEYKKIIIFLMAGLMALILILYHKQNIKEDIIPKKASFVFKKIDEERYYV